jgi:hypothetical protein
MHGGARWEPARGVWSARRAALGPRRSTAHRPQPPPPPREAIPLSCYTALHLNLSSHSLAAVAGSSLLFSTRLCPFARRRRANWLACLGLFLSSQQAARGRAARDTHAPASPTTCTHERSYVLQVQHQFAAISRTVKQHRELALGPGREEERGNYPPAVARAVRSGCSCACNLCLLHCWLC